MSLAKTYHASGSQDLIQSVFVKTNAYKKVRNQTKCILIGRKGSGKSTIVDNYHRILLDQYKPPISVHVNNFQLDFIYKFLTEIHDSEVGDIVTYINYFHTVWLVFFYFEAIKTIADEQNKGHNLSDMTPYLEKIDFLDEIRSMDYWPMFTRVCEKVKNLISDSVTESKTDKTFFSEIASKTGRSELIGCVLGKNVIAPLCEMIGSCKRKLVFALDGFDSNFEEFRFYYTGLPADHPDKDRMSRFERAWLIGLMRALLDVRGGHSFISNKMDFCVTIPQDRFREVRGFERDDYQYSALSDEIRWTGYELAIMLRKRIERLIDDGFISRKNLPPLERLEEVLAYYCSRLPSSIQIKSRENVVSISLFKYLLRHTFWRPRDVLYLVAALITTNDMLNDIGRQMTVDIVKEVVSRTTYEIINSEFIQEYKTNIINIRKVIDVFEGAPIIMPYDELEIYLDNISIITNGNIDKITDNNQILDLLFEIGFLGLVVSDRLKRMGLKGAEYFSFSDGDHIYHLLDQSRRRQERYCIHPIFCEYLVLDAEMGRVTLAYSDNYLASNDVVGTL